MMNDFGSLGWLLKKLIPKDNKEYMRPGSMEDYYYCLSNRSAFPEVLPRCLWGRGFEAQG